MALLKVSKELHQLAQRLVGDGMRLFVVGGSVRDALMGETPDDLDLMVVGGTKEQVEAVVGKWHKLRKQVHSTAPVMHALVGGEWVDLAVARVEFLPEGQEVGLPGDFGFRTGADVTLEMDLKRRDFTVGAFAWDVLSKSLVDFFDGQHDLAFAGGQGRLMPVDPVSFMESADRPLRAAQFTARFGFAITPVLARLSAEMKEHVGKLSGSVWWKNFRKLLLSKDPSRGVRAFVLLGLVDLLPGWEALSKTKQDSEWHPEGNADVHTLHALDEAVRLTEDKDDDTKLVVRGAVLLHDMGKVSTTVRHPETGRWVSPGHAQETELAEAFLRRVGFPNKLRPRVLALVRAHMRVAESRKAVRRLSAALEPATLEEWALVVKSDLGGRPGVDPEKTAKRVARVERTLELAAEMALDKGGPVELLKGHGDRLLAEGLVTQGPAMGTVLRAAFQAQLDGEFNSVDGGVEWVRKFVEGQ